ncbi:hypothetical protein QTP88_011844 [Uroleucon formosanum]
MSRECHCAVESEMDQSAIGSKMDQCEIESKMDQSEIESKIDRNAIESKMDQNTVESEMNQSEIESEMDQVVVKIETDQDKMVIPTVLLKESEIKKEETKPCVTISALTILSKDGDESKSIPMPMPLTMAEHQGLSVLNDYKNYNPSEGILISCGSNSKSSLQHNQKKTLRRKRSLIPSYIEVENTQKTMKPGPKSKTRNLVTVHQMITEAKMVRSGVTHDYSDTSDVEIIKDDSGDENDSFDDENDSHNDFNESMLNYFELFMLQLF